MPQGLRMGHLSKVSRENFGLICTCHCCSLWEALLLLKNSLFVFRIPMDLPDLARCSWECDIGLSKGCINGCVSKSLTQNYTCIHIMPCFFNGSMYFFPNHSVFCFYLRANTRRGFNPNVSLHSFFYIPLSCFYYVLSVQEFSRAWRVSIYKIARKKKWSC